MTASKIFLYFCLSFIAGIFLSSFIFFSQIFLLGILILGILLFSLWWPYKKIAVIGFCLLFLALGIWRFQIAELNVIENELAEYNDLKEDIVLIGKVISEPDIRETNIKLTIKTEEVFVKEKSLFFKDRVLVTTDRYPEYKYGDKLKITGRLQSPPVFEEFNYQDFLKKEGIYSVVYWPEIELLERGEYDNFFSWSYAMILEFKERLRKSIYQNLSPPQSSILGAMILGDARKMSEDLKEKLNIAGVRHITAISGMHITVLSVILMQILIGIGFWRGQAFYFTLIFIFLFIAMVGFPVSAIRAGIMGGLFLFAQKIGRLSVSFRTIFFAATLMVAFNPFLLSLDVGFQLSFMAMIGIIYLSPVIKDWLKFVPPGSFRNILAMTISAYIFTLPILIYNFGYVSIVSLITNVLVVPLLPFIMLSGFIFGVAGMILQPLGQIFSWISWFLLTYLTKIVDFFSSIPPAYFIGVSWVWLLIFYLVLGFFTWQLNRKKGIDFFEYPDWLLKK